MPIESQKLHVNSPQRKYRLLIFTTLFIAITLGLTLTQVRTQQRTESLAQAKAETICAPLPPDPIDNIGSARKEDVDPEDAPEIEQELKTKVREYIQAEPNTRPRMKQSVVTLAEKRKKILRQKLHRNPDKTIQELKNDTLDEELNIISQNCAPEQIDVEGTVEIEHVDYFESGSEASGWSREDYFAITKKYGRVKLHGSDAIRNRLQPADTIRGKGFKVDKEVMLDAVDVENPQNVRGFLKKLFAPVYAAVPSWALGEQKTIVLMVNYSNTSYNWDIPKTNQTITSVNDFFKENSYNKSSVTGKVIAVPIPLARSSSCDDSAVMTAAVQAADPQVDFRQYNRVMVYAPMNCDYAGKGSIGSSSLTTADGSVSIGKTWIKAREQDNAPFAGVTAHEFGHNVGIHHAAFFDCGNASFGCSPTEYGDAHDVMGHAANMRHFNAPHKDEIGYFNPGNVATATKNGSYTIEPIETAGTGVKALKVYRGPGNDDYLWVEYRRPIGFDAKIPNAISSGALIHGYCSGSSSTNVRIPARTCLIAASPPTNVNDAALQIGESFTDPQGGAKITVTNRTDSALTVQVTLGNGSIPQPTNAPSGKPTIPASTSTPGTTITKKPTTSQEGPTPTPPAGSTIFTINAALHGIGSAGDNVNPDNSEFSNKLPSRTSRPVTLELLSSEDTVAATLEGFVMYSASTGTFTGTVAAQDIPPGVYQPVITIDGYLSRKTGSFVTVSDKKSITLPLTTLINGDTDNDNRLTILDYNSIINCYTYPGFPSPCDAFESQLGDLDDNGENNEFDANLFLRELSVQSGD